MADREERTHNTILYWLFGARGQEALAIVADLLMVALIGVLLLSALIAVSLDFRLSSSVMTLAILAATLALLALLYLSVRRSIRNIKRDAGEKSPEYRRME